MIPEKDLLTAGFLRERCSEGLQHVCPGCGTEMLGVSSMDWSTGVVCPTCSEVVLKPLISCARCKQTLPGDLESGERGCLSIKAYKESGAVPAFGPSEPIWAFRRTVRSKVSVVGDAELRARLSSGELEGTWLVRGPNDETYRAIAEVAGLRELIVPLNAPASLSGTGAPRAAVGSELGPRGARTGLSGSTSLGGPSRPPEVVAPPGASRPRPTAIPPRSGSTPPSIPPVLPTPAAESSGARGASWPKSTLLTWGSMLLAYFGAVGVLAGMAEVMPPVAEEMTPGDWIGTMLVAALMSFFGFRGIARRSKAPGTVSAIVLGVSVLTAVPAFEEFVQSHKNKENRIGDAKLGEPPEGEDAKREARTTAEQAATAPKRISAQKPVLGEAWMVADVGLKMVPIAPGSFSMGSTNGDEDERPVTQVTLTRPYWLGAAEVTQRQWETVMGTNPSGFKGANLPVEQVSYEDALVFCQKLTERERAADHLPAGYVYTLPTEAQWEYACRAGTTGDHAGNLDAMGWYSGNSGNKAHEVGGKQANAWGLHDMHGNVWEWCLDWRGNYTGGNVTDPRVTASGSFRVYRGGSWGYDADNCRSANRDGVTPGFRFNILGFRLALSSEIIR